MQNRTGMQLEMLTRVERVVWSHPELASVANSPAGAALHAAITELVDHSGRQDQGARESRGGTARQRTALRRLRVQMRALSAAARLKLRTSPDFVKFTMPSTKAGAEPTLAAAQGMSEAAQRHTMTLQSAGLKPECLTELNTAAVEVRAALTDRGEHRGARRNATASIRAAASDIQSLLRVLDGMVLPLLEANPGLLAEWQAAKRIGYKAGGARTTTPPATAGAPVAVDDINDIKDIKETKEVIAPAA